VWIKCHQILLKNLPVKFTTDLLLWSCECSTDMVEWPVDPLPWSANTEYCPMLLDIRLPQLLSINQSINQSINVSLLHHNKKPSIIDNLKKMNDAMRACESLLAYQWLALKLNFVIDCSIANTNTIPHDYSGLKVTLYAVKSKKYLLFYKFDSHH
jgi:hypothetical protein